MKRSNFTYVGTNPLYFGKTVKVIEFIKDNNYKDGEWVKRTDRYDWAEDDIYEVLNVEDKGNGKYKVKLLSTKEYTNRSGKKYFHKWNITINELGQSNSISNESQKGWYWRYVIVNC